MHEIWNADTAFLLSGTDLFNSTEWNVLAVTGENNIEINIQLKKWQLFLINIANNRFIYMKTKESIGELCCFCARRLYLLLLTFSFKCHIFFCFQCQLSSKWLRVSVLYLRILKKYFWMFIIKGRASIFCLFVGTIMGLFVCVFINERQNVALFIDHNTWYSWVDELFILATALP